MGRGLFISKSYYDRYQKFRCPLQMGFWHYSPNGCCMFIEDKTKTIHHLYIRESCSLTKDGRTVQKILTNSDNDNNTNTIPCDNRFLNVSLQPYLANSTIITSVDQRILSNMNCESKNRILKFYDESLQQYWFIVCDTTLSIDNNRITVTDNVIQNKVLQQLYGPLFFCSSTCSLVGMIRNITTRFFFQQMPRINNIHCDKLLRKLSEDITFISGYPAVKMLQPYPSGNLCFMDARDLYDFVKLGHSEYITNMRPVHITNEATFLDTWRRIVFNLMQELVNISSFDRQNIRIRSNCNAQHFIRGNNKHVIPEFRCDADQRSKCIHLKTRQKEYEIMKERFCTMPESKNMPDDKYTITLSDNGVICRHVLEVMVEEYGDDEVDRVLKFHCFFHNTVFEHTNTETWERVVRESMGIDRHLYIKDGSSVSRERISCMQMMCNQKRMNDIHRFCLPKRFLTIFWFKWASDALKLSIFDED